MKLEKGRLLVIADLESCGVSAVPSSGLHPRLYLESSVVELLCKWPIVKVRLLLLTLFTTVNVLDLYSLILTVAGLEDTFPRFFTKKMRGLIDVMLHWCRS